MSVGDNPVRVWLVERTYSDNVLASEPSEGS